MLPTDTWYTQPTFLFGRPRLFFGGNLYFLNCRVASYVASVARGQLWKDLNLLLIP